MKNENGFTLIELLAASWIAVMVGLTVIPLISFGQKTWIQNRKQTEAKMAADAAFECAARQLVMADAVILGTPDDWLLEDQDGWHKLYPSDERYSVFAPNWQIRLHACKESDRHLRLGVSVIEENEVLFEHSELLFLLNVNLRKERIIEVVATDEIFNEFYEIDEIWYRKTNEEERREGYDEA